MKPSPELVLNQAFAKLAMDIAPALPASYSQGALSTTGILLLMVGQEVNRAADIRVKENAAMRRLFRETAAAVSGPLKAKLEGAAATADPDVTLATLDASNTVLKKVLIALQTFAEANADRGLSRRIAELLQSFATARQVVLPAF